MRDDFAVFILTHGRPDNVQTYRTLQTHGYTGRVYIVIDDEDKTADRYVANFGQDNVLIFSKAEISTRFDEADNFGDRRTIVYARNACFDLADKLGIPYFVQLDDDYVGFYHRTADTGGFLVRNLDALFSLLVDFMADTSVASIALSQGGDHIGGYDDTVLVKRKAMNSFFCATDRRFSFVGRINEDVNTYVRQGSVGKVFLTVMNAQLNQETTQKTSGGMTDVYLASGTYVKSFYSVMINPSCVRVANMGRIDYRLHHLIDWARAVPCIISEDYRKSA